MQAHIIALGIDLAHLVHRDAQQFGAVRHPQFIEEAAGFLAALPAARERAFDRAFEPVSGDRLEDIIDRIAIERLDREMIMRGHEDHHRRLFLFSQLARHAEPIDLGHGHIEQHQIGFELFSQPERSGAVTCGADHLHTGDFGADHLHPLDRQRFVIDDERAQGGGFGVAIHHGGSSIL